MKTLKPTSMRSEAFGALNTEVPILIAVPDRRRTPMLPRAAHRKTPVSIWSLIIRGKKSVFCIATSRHQADQILLRLKTAGFPSKDLSALFPDNEVNYDFAQQKKKESTARGAQPGVLARTAWWAARRVGFATIGALCIPGAGSFIAVGPIIAALSDASEGNGGIAAELIRIGIPEFEARRYEWKIKEGNILISLHSRNSREIDQAKAIFAEIGAHQVCATGETEFKDRQMTELESRPAQRSPSRSSIQAKMTLLLGLVFGTFTIGGNAAQAPVSLGSAAGFAVLAGSTVTSIGGTVVGNVGVSPGSEVTGFPPGRVTGTMHVSDPTAAQAQADLTTGYNDAAGRTLAPVNVAGNLGGLTLAPGLYKSTSGLEITSGNLILDAQGDANAVFIFQMASTLVTTSDRQVILSGGARAANVYWQVGTSATLGSGSIFKGTIMADQSIAMGTGATVDGRALARIGAVVLDANAVTIPTTNTSPGPLSFGPIHRALNGAATLIITNTPGVTLTLQTSADLTTWTTLAKPTPAVSPDVYIDTTASVAATRFYRAFYP